MSQHRKNQEVDKFAEDPVVYFDSRRIPFDIWEEIFQYTTGKDLLRFSLVCKNIYEIIGNSPEAMDKIVLKIYERDEVDLSKLKIEILQSSRNYKHFKFEGIRYMQDISGSKIYLKFFEKTLRSLELNWCNFTAEEFSDILNATQKNLRALNIHFTRIVENSSTISSKTLSKLEKLGIFYSDLGPIQDFLPDNLLEVNSNFCWQDELQLVKFLERQKNLKHLDVTLLHDKLFFAAINSANINFKLEKFSFFSENDTDCKDIDKFLKSHSENLKELRLANVSVNKFYDSFKNMPKLKSLELDRYVYRINTAQCESGPSFNCPTLKTLSLSFNWSNLSLLNFTQRFSNVQKLVLLTDTCFQLIEKIAENHPNLKVLVLYSFNDIYLKSVSFKNLTTLEIRELKFSEMEINLETSINAMENLEILKLDSYVLVTEHCLLQILAFKKLKHLEIFNGYRLSDDILNRQSKLLSRVGFVKICNVGKPPIQEEEFES